MAECYAADWEVMCLVCSWSRDGSTKLGPDKTCSSITTQGRSLAAPGGVPGRPENHIMAPQILQAQCFPFNFF